MNYCYYLPRWAYGGDLPTTGRMLMGLPQPLPNIVTFTLALDLVDYTQIYQGSQ